MGIFSRIGEIVNANINAMLDKAEDPAKMVQLMIHEMEDTLMEIKSSAAEVIADQKRLHRAIARENKRVEEWDSKAALALQKEREDLARLALEQKLASQEKVTHLDERLKEVDVLVAQYKEDIARLNEKLQSAKQRQRAMEESQKRAEARKNVEEKIYQVNTSSAFSRFEDYEARLSRMEADAEVLSIGNQNLERQFAELEKEGMVTEELEKLKKNLNKPKTPEKKTSK